MGPPSYMPSVVDRNVGMRPMTVTPLLGTKWQRYVYSTLDTTSSFIATEN